MKNKYAIVTVCIVSVIIFLLISQRTLDVLFVNYTSPRLSNSTIYGSGCRENPFHKRLETLFRTWVSIATRRNLTYFVCYGALLGLYRDGDVIPFDNDLDVCIFRNELYKLEMEDEPKPFKADDGKTHLIYQRHCHHPKIGTPRKTCKGVEVTKDVDQCTFLDPCARIVLRPPTSERTTWIDVFALRDNDSYLLDDWKRKTHKRAIIFPLKPCVFIGIQTVCPNNITGYLTRYYGNDFATKSHYVCKNGEWMANTDDAKDIAVPRCPKNDLFCKANVFIRGITNKIKY